jgi:hypothetical protein
MLLSSTVVKQFMPFLDWICVHEPASAARLNIPAGPWVAAAMAARWDNLGEGERSLMGRSMSGEDSNTAGEVLVAHQRTDKMDDRDRILGTVTEPQAQVGCGHPRGPAGKGMEPYQTRLSL